MIFSGLLILFTLTDKIEGDGMMILGFAGFCELCGELGMLGAYLHL